MTTKDIRDIRDIVDLGISSLTDDALVAAHYDLTTEERIQVLDLRLLQLLDITFLNFQASPDVKTADFLSKLIPIIKKELGGPQETAKETGDSQLDDFLASTYMGQDGTEELP